VVEAPEVAKTGQVLNRKKEKGVTGKGALF